MITSMVPMLRINAEVTEGEPKRLKTKVQARQTGLSFNYQLLHPWLSLTLIFLRVLVQQTKVLRCS